VAKFFNGVDFDDNGHIKVKPTEPFRWVQPVSYTAPVAYRANELDRMPDTDFEHLKRWVEREEHRRELVAKQKLLHSQEAYEQLSNFLQGCAHAMACRAALRWGRGLRPFSPDGKRSGGTPTGGEMWNIFDVAELDKKILQDSFLTHDAVTYDGVDYIINANPMVWNTRATINNWLLNSFPNFHYPGYEGTRFCLTRKSNK
jgi:hypothetical protein